MNLKKIFLNTLLIMTLLPVWAERYIVDVGQFENLKINGNISVIYKNLPDSTGMAFYISEPGNEDVFEFVTKKAGTLKVSPNDEKWGRKDLPVLHVYSDFLTSLESFSDQEVEVRNIVPCASLSINQVGNGSISVENIKSNIVSAAITTGNGTINLSGTCTTANFRMVGAGLISADRLQAENVKCSILGTGSIGCWPVDDLKVSGIGSTKIYYKGRPNIKKTGGGKLFELPEEPQEIPQLNPIGVVTSLNPPANDDDDEEDEDDDEDEDEEEEVEIDDELYQTVVTADD